MKNNKSRKVQMIINLIAIALIIGLFIFLYFYFKEDITNLNTDEGRQNFIKKIQGTGFWGGFILVFIQALQVVVAFIPGEFVEISSGLMYGPFLGLILCLIGLNIGTLIIFGLVKLLGKPFVKQNVNLEKSGKFKFLEDPNRALVIMFFIFLIPGIPKDLFIYPVPLTKVKMWKFMIVSTIARIPSIVSSTFLGNAILDKNYLVAGIIFGVFLILSILGLVFNKKIYDFIDKKIIKKRKLKIK